MNHIIKRSSCALSTALMVVFVMGGIPHLHGASQAQQAEPKAPLKTLYERAREKSRGNTYIRKVDITSGVNYSTMKDIVEHSDAILIGRVERSNSKLTSDGRTIITSLQVKTRNVMKGDIKPNKTVVIAIPLGTYRYKDGLIIKTFSRYYKEPMTNRTYAFFLSRNKENTGEWMVVGGSQGQFEIDYERNKIIPSDIREGATINLAYQYMEPSVFMRKVYRWLPHSKS